MRNIAANGSLELPKMTTETKAYTHLELGRMVWDTPNNRASIEVLYFDSPEAVEPIKAEVVEIEGQEFGAWVMQNEQLIKAVRASWLGIAAAKNKIPANFVDNWRL